jgi:sporulation protein YlmC with PRC-barrel domain
MSLQTGKELAVTGAPVIDPKNLKLLAYTVDGPHLDHNPSFLRVNDIREIGQLGFIVDSSDEFVILDDIINDKKLYEDIFEILGKKVVDDTKKKLGKVESYIIDMDDFVIKQLLVKKPFLKSFNDDEFLISRSQIVEINDDMIIVRSTRTKLKEETKKEKGEYINPFRRATPQPESAHTDSQS